MKIFPLNLIIFNQFNTLVFTTPSVELDIHTINIFLRIRKKNNKMNTSQYLFVCEKVKYEMLT